MGLYSHAHFPLIFQNQRSYLKVISCQSIDSSIENIVSQARHDQLTYAIIEINSRD